MKHIEIQLPHMAGYAALCALAKRGKGKKSLNVPVETVGQMLEAYEDMLDILAVDDAKKPCSESRMAVPLFLKCNRIGL